MSAKASPTITICMGSSCFLRGNNRNIEVIQNYLASPEGSASAELVGHLCQGKCKAGPNITINGNDYHQVDPVSIIRLLNHYLPREAT